MSTPYFGQPQGRPPAGHMWDTTRGVWVNGTTREVREAKPKRRRGDVATATPPPQRKMRAIVADEGDEHEKEEEEESDEARGVVVGNFENEVDEQFQRLRAQVEQLSQKVKQLEAGQEKLEENHNKLVAYVRRVEVGSSNPVLPDALIAPID